MNRRPVPLPTDVARFRFHGNLNDFLPRNRRGTLFLHSFRGSPALKDVIESLGPPHPEIGRILVDGTSADWTRALSPGNRVDVFPHHTNDPGALGPPPLTRFRFVLDGHLGTLARRLRMLGFDALYEPDYDDPRIVDLSVAETRMILTRDRGLLKRSRVRYGYWVRATEPPAQIREVVRRFDLASRFRPFSRCLTCNGELAPQDLETVRSRIPPGARARVRAVRVCVSCQRLFWDGTHVERMRARVEALREL